jgi:hypothetical protein
VDGVLLAVASGAQYERREALREERAEVFYNEFPIV